MRRKISPAGILQAMMLCPCVVVATSWALSYVRLHAASFELPAGTVFSMHAGNGIVAAAWRGYSPTPLGRSRLSFSLLPAQELLRPNTFWMARGFYRAIGSRSLGVRFPHWFAMLVVAIPPVSMSWWRKWRRVRRARHGLCIHCGYDLRGLRSAQCPECGAPAEGMAEDKGSAEGE
jgi:hypothetical protein